MGIDGTTKMEIKLLRAGTVYVIDISGEMDLYNAFRLKEVVAGMIARKVREYVISLEKVDYMDSSGIGALLSVHAELKKRGMPLRIAGVQGSVKKVIELTKLSGYLPLCADTAEGITQIRKLAAG
jgi:anti-sigma B factor antagonist